MKETTMEFNCRIIFQCENFLVGTFRQSFKLQHVSLLIYLLPRATRERSTNLHNGRIVPNNS